MCNLLRKHYLSHNLFSMKLKNRLPILTWLPNYKKSDLKGDIFGGLTVGVMLIPQGMAYAMIAGLPPIYGLYASLIPQVIYAIFGTSRQLAVGPVAMDSLLVANGVGALAASGTEEYIAMAIFLAMMMGIIQIISGLVRLGFLANFLSKPVISGFTFGAALIIGLNQLKHLIGVDIKKSSQLNILLMNTFERITEVHWLTFAIGIAGIIILLIIKKKAKRLPGALIVVILGTLLVVFLDLDKQGVKVVGDIPQGLPVFAIPEISDMKLINKLLPIAGMIAIVAFMESYSVAKAIEAERKDYKVDANQEMFALGMSNFVGSLFSSYPGTGGFSRSAVSNQAGSNTPLYNVFSASLIAITLLFLTQYFYFLPKSILASIIMVAVFGLIKPKIIKNLWKVNKIEVLMLATTFSLTIFFGIVEGILTGVVFSLLLVIYKATYPHVAELARIKSTPYYRNKNRYDNVETRNDVLIVRFDAQLFFANVSYLIEKIDKMIEEREKNSVKLVILNAESVTSIDATAAEKLREYLKELKSQNIRFNIVSVNGPVRDMLYRSELMNEIGEDGIYFHIAEAIDYFDGKSKVEELKQYHLQTNQ